jgi:Nif-specific regulatory protein
VSQATVQQSFERTSEELAALYEINKALASALDLRESAVQVLGILSSKLAMKGGTITLLDPASGELAIEVSHGLRQEQQARGRYRIGEGITGKVYETGQPIVVPDLLADQRFLNRTGAHKGSIGQKLSFLAVPIKVHGETLGVLGVDRLFPGDPESFDEDLRVLSIVALLIGQAVKLNRLVAQERPERIIAGGEQQSEMPWPHRFVGGFVGQSAALEEVFGAIARVAQSQATVMLRGESGTGKELVATAIHHSGPRAEKPFIRLHCAAVPEMLFESELFGHERGAFTGATEMRKGRFELADQGTLFLDEIGDIPLATQMKLLRVLQDQRFERVGGSQTYEVDVRLISATHQDLEAMVKSGAFREDLYYRLNVVPITLPPLRERVGDIPLLIEHFLGKYNKQNRREVRLSADLVKLMAGYHWPGNVRELENCIERLVVMTGAEKVSLGTIPTTLRGYFTDMRHVSQPDPSARTNTLTGNLAVIEQDRLKKTLDRAGWVQARAARTLGITPRQIAYKIRKYRLRPDDSSLS